MKKKRNFQCCAQLKKRQNSELISDDHYLSGMEVLEIKVTSKVTSFMLVSLLARSNQYILDFCLEISTGMCHPTAMVKTTLLF